MGDRAMNHLADEQLLDAFYGDAVTPDREHLENCAECRARFRQIQETLETLRDYPVPERSDSYGTEVWARLGPQLQTVRSKRKWLWAWTLVPALATMLAITFFAGVWTERRRTSAPDNSHERVLLMAMSDHLERSQIVLTELVHANSGTADLRTERERARNLLGENRLLRQTAIHLGDRRDAALLDDLERVLLDLANGSPATNSEDLKMLQQRVENDGLLWKIRITSTNAREEGQKL
jgi:hypothetical protein